MKWLVPVAALALAGCAAQPVTGADDALGGTVTVFAAASLTESFDAIATRFEAEHPGVDVVVNYGGSSALATQIVEGAPADVFAAASGTTMEAVGDLAVDPAVFATNTLQIAVPVGNPGGVTGLADLARPDLAVALCAVEVPCGAAAKTALDDAGVAASVDTFEQDVKAVLTKVELGEVDAGLVYVTDVTAAGDHVEGITLPDAPATAYPIAALRDSANPDAATAFVEYVQSGRAQGILAAAGFGAP